MGWRDIDRAHSELWCHLGVASLASRSVVLMDIAILPVTWAAMDMSGAFAPCFVPA